MERRWYEAKGTLTESGIIRLAERVSCPAGEIALVISPLEPPESTEERTRHVTDDEVRVRNGRIGAELEKWAGDPDNLAPEQEAEFEAILAAGVQLRSRCPSQ